jgi:hypothetical protein
MRRILSYVTKWVDQRVNNVPVDYIGVRKLRDVDAAAIGYAYAIVSNLTLWVAEMLDETSLERVWVAVFGHDYIAVWRLGEHEIEDTSPSLIQSPSQLVDYTAHQKSIAP